MTLSAENRTMPWVSHEISISLSNVGNRELLRVKKMYRLLISELTSFASDVKRSKAFVDPKTVLLLLKTTK